MKNCVWILQQRFHGSCPPFLFVSSGYPFQTASLSSRGIPGGHINSLLHRAPLLCLKHRSTHLLRLMHACYGQLVVSCPSPLSRRYPARSMHLQMCVVSCTATLTDIEGVACISIFAWREPNAAAHFALNSRRIMLTTGTKTIFHSHPCCIANVCDRPLIENRHR